MSLSVSPPTYMIKLCGWIEIIFQKNESLTLITFDSVSQNTKRVPNWHLSRSLRVGFDFYNAHVTSHM